VHLLMSIAVLLAGLCVAVFLHATPEMQIFGYVLAVIGALGVAGALVIRRRSR
jgi:hypothetical protein